MMMMYYNNKMLFAGNKYKRCKVCMLFCSLYETFMYSFIHPFYSFDQYLLSVKKLAGILLGTRITAVYKMYAPPQMKWIL